LGPIDDLLWRVDPPDAAQVHDGDPVGDLHRLRPVVGDEDRREPGALVVLMSMAAADRGCARRRAQSPNLSPPAD
jgi:hypothetical protein